MVKRFIGAAMCLVLTGAAVQAATATYYGGRDGYSGKRTASGERYNPNGMTAASRTFPLGTVVNVCGVSCVTVRINDRGGPRGGIDLSMAAARVACGGLRSCHVQIGR
jgi:rare lipoprotein A